MKQANKLTTRKSRVQGKHRTAGYKVVKHKSSDVSFSATKAVTKSSVRSPSYSTLAILTFITV
jgi:hypothetical protein